MFDIVNVSFHFFHLYRTYVISYNYFFMESHSSGTFYLHTCKFVREFLFELIGIFMAKNIITAIFQLAAVQKL